MKRIISIFAVLLMSVFAVSEFTGCSKEEILDLGTLSVRALNPDGDIAVKVYPYVADYDRLPPVASSILNQKNTTASFDLNAGNYIITSKGSGIDRRDCVQIHASETCKVDL